MWAKAIRSKLSLGGGVSLAFMISLNFVCFSRQIWNSAEILVKLMCGKGALVQEVAVVETLSRIKIRWIQGKFDPCCHVFKSCHMNCDVTVKEAKKPNITDKSDR